jgi:photosystem II stability/assembly factor-like uncharacterized protein
LNKFLIAILLFFLTACSPSQISAEATLSSFPPLPAPALSPTGTPSVLPLVANTPTNTQTPLPPLNAGQSITITSLHMINPAVGWALETAGHILRTVDGGSTWKDVTPPQGSNVSSDLFPLYVSGGFFPLNEDQAWATPQQLICYASNCSIPQFTIIWRTADGGQSWQPSQPISEDTQGIVSYYPIDFQAPKSIQFLDSKIGWFLISTYFRGGRDTYFIFRTVDGGVNWEAIFATPRPDLFSASGIAFLDAHNAWLGTEHCGGWCGLPNANGVDTIWMNGYHTTDGASTWMEKTLPLPHDFPIGFIEHGYACGQDQLTAISAETIGIVMYCQSPSYTSSPAEEYYYFFLSSDNGQSWRYWPTAGTFFLNNASGWSLSPPVPGRTSQLQKTTDGGRTWTTIKQVAWTSAQFSFTSEQVGWAIVSDGANAAFVHTTNGGKTWKIIKPVIVPQNLSGRFHTPEGG